MELTRRESDFKNGHRLRSGIVGGIVGDFTLLRVQPIGRFIEGGIGRRICDLPRLASNWLDKTKPEPAAVSDEERSAIGISKDDFDVIELISLEMPGSFSMGIGRRS
jgi:hypothetical protein